MRLQIWDTAGTELHRCISNQYYQSASGVILTYGVDDRSSFDNISTWIEELQKHAEKNICIMLIGNKVDLPDDKIKVTTEEGMEKA